MNKYNNNSGKISNKNKKNNVDEFVLSGKFRVRNEKGPTRSGRPLYLYFSQPKQQDAPYAL
jgi:hypothetical protein